MRVEVSVTIQRPLEDVFAYITNFENNPRWQSGMQECRFTSEPPLRVGSTYKQVARFLGQRIESTFEVLEYEPNRMIRFHSTSGTFPIRIMRAVEPAGNGTKVTAVIEGDPGGLLKLAAPLVRDEGDADVACGLGLHVKARAVFVFGVVIARSLGGGRPRVEREFRQDGQLSAAVLGLGKSRGKTLGGVVVEKHIADERDCERAFVHGATRLPPMGMVRL
jgi:carbon monoxide dehydrogenase subunit G